MGWGTSFTAELYLSKKVFKHKYELESAIEYCEDEIENIKSNIHMYASSNINDVVPKEFENEKISFIQREMSQLLRDLQDETIKLHLLRIYKDSNPKFEKNE